MTAHRAQPDPTRYVLLLSAAEREHLLTALELAVALGRGEDRRLVRGLVADLDADALDALADTLFLAGAPRDALAVGA